MELNQIERLNFINQFLILEKLDSENAKYYQKCRIILENGYKIEYDNVFDFVFEEIPESICIEVSDILEMYNTMNRCCPLDHPDISKEEVRFRGFDLNKEYNQLSYADFLIKETDQFNEIGKSLNKVPPMLNRYRKMLSLWNQFSNKDYLSVKQIRQLIDS